MHAFMYAAHVLRPYIVSRSKLVSARLAAQICLMSAQI